MVLAGRPSSRVGPGGTGSQCTLSHLPLYTLCCSGVSSAPQLSSSCLFVFVFAFVFVFVFVTIIVCSSLTAQHQQRLMCHCFDKSTRVIKTLLP